MYNVLLAMPQGIEILNRRPHGPSGVTYLPHGVDAAVGRAVDGINLIFKNTYPFPIVIEADAHDGALFIAIRKAL
jgi:vancomycin resistance protein YoaR